MMVQTKKKFVFFSYTSPNVSLSTSATPWSHTLASVGLPILPHSTEKREKKGSEK